MIKTILFIIATFFSSACVNKHGISAQYHSDCKEYYDFQGYYHKECGEDDIITYKEMGEATDKAYDTVTNIFTEKKEKPKPNVW